MESERKNKILDFINDHGGMANVKCIAFKGRELNDYEIKLFLPINHTAIQEDKFFDDMLFTQTESLVIWFKDGSWSYGLKLIECPEIPNECLE